MIYISAQPDDFYFTWQLEIQIRNLRNLKIPRECIHVIVGYNPLLGLKPLFQDLITRNSELAQFYIYPDSRQSKEYISSIRPNILKQHFSFYPELENEVIFYHDSDVLFSRIPVLDVSCNTKCYVSDTRSYLDSKYIINNSSYDVFKSMSEIVGISTKMISDQDMHAGGAQYILKGINSSFWDKVERDSQMIYDLLQNYNRSLWMQNFVAKGSSRSNTAGIQAWCADMWAVLWNLWYFNKQVEIHPEMDFSWPDSPIENWKKNSILHYSGGQEGVNLSFKKTKYIHFPPWYDEILLNIPDTTCSYEVVQSIIARKNELDEDRYHMPNVSFILFAKFSNHIKIETLNITLRYLKKYFNCQSILVVSDNNKYAKISDSLIINVEDLKNTLNEIRNIDFLFFSPFECIIDVESMVQLINAESGYRDSLCISYESSWCFSLDPIFTKTFSMVLDDKLLSSNVNKFEKSINDKVRTYFVSYKRLLNDILEDNITFKQLFTKLDSAIESSRKGYFYKLSNLPKNNQVNINGSV
ncbi:hypothetical protein [Sphingobacterium bovisgrunnientis]|uniref:hypothetical protein n=1 Tax=Sphingobacterium bovisgrunnientis TaxID=1874697 RepID=UPI00135CE665|nr:hypothetical protein [Sphingobacterium bovisgrunnientis]